jgi:hypothetical protein
MPKTIMNLRRQDCRFILPDGRYCAQPRVEPTSFCEEHKRLCYVPKVRKPKGEQHVR